MTTPFVAVLMGSDSDLPVMQAAFETFKQLRIPFEARVTSAHRTPEDARQYVESAEKRGCAVFICAAGLAAHLAGCVAAHTCKPVIGVPMAVGGLQGLDALLSTVQMPGGVPVACVAIGKAGAQNAAWLSAQILALKDEALAKRLRDARQENVSAIARKNQALQAALQTL